MIELKLSVLTHPITLLILSGLLLAFTGLISYIKSLKRKQKIAQHFDPIYMIPNMTALISTSSRLATENNTYLYVATWFSGLDRIEMVMGVDYYRKLFRKLNRNLQKELNSENYTYTHKLVDKELYSAFLSEKNMIGVFLKPDQAEYIKAFEDTIHKHIDIIRNEYKCNMRIQPLITGAHSTTLPLKPFNLILQNTHTAMLHSYQADWELTLYSKEIKEIEHKKILLINDFKRSLKKGQLFLLWQPQLSAQTKKIVGIEALTRWRHPTHGLVHPDVFIPVLEESRQITLLSCWVIGKAFETSKSLQTVMPLLKLSVNLSVYDLTDPLFMDYLKSITQANPGVSKSITLEMTESMMLKDNEQALHFVVAIQQMGFNFSIDDFGAGYSSFGYLEAIPADELKIDKRFADSYSKKNTQIIIKGVIEMAKKLNMQVVVEGIEHEAQEELFTNWGAERLQGWRYGKPMNLEALLNKFSDKKAMPVL